jgi:hypothetical protein
MSWEGVAAVATFGAVIVALIPIWQAARRRRAHAINLRSRILGKLVLLKPSLKKITPSGKDVSNKVVMKKDRFAETIRSIESMLPEASVLRPVEQDQLNTVFLNLELVVSVYGSSAFTVDMAEELLGEIDKLGSVLDKRSVSRHKTRKLLKAKIENERKSSQKKL